MKRRSPTHPKFMISRIDHEGTHCWFVRLHRIGIENISRSFSDKKIGGKAKALRSAQAFRDELLRDYGVPDRSFHVHDRRSTSGFVGVHLSVCKKTYGEVYSWSVRFMIGNGISRCQAHRSFGIRKYGYAEAYRRAVRLRLGHTAGLRLPRVLIIPPPPPKVRRWLASI